MKWTDKLALIAITLWVGALWAIGGIAAPTLFYQLADKMQAGNLAGQDRKSTRLNSSHMSESRMPSSA